jgi:tetratricopeptide (TPR) repeat protein
VEAASTLAEAARHLLARGNAARALATYEQAVEVNPNDASIRLQLGRAYVTERRYDNAREHLERSVALNPTAAARVELARTYQAEERIEEALREVDEALSLAAQDPEALTVKGDILYRMQRHDEALQILEQAIASDPSMPQAHAEKGAILEGLGQAKPAIAAFERSVELDPGYAWAHARLGFLRLSLGDSAGALAAINTALALSPSPTADLHVARGQALYYLASTTSAFNEAVRAFDEALRLDPSNSEAFRYRGYALRSLDRYEDAIHSLQIAIELDGAHDREDPRTYAELGESLRLLLRFRQARSAFRKAMRLWGDDAEPWALARYGETLRVLSKHDDAIGYLQRAVAIDPNDGFAWGSLGAAQFDAERYRSALASLERAIALNDQNGWAWGWVGILWLFHRQFARAFEALDKALQFELNAAWITLAKGEALRGLGPDGPQRALPVLREAVRLDPSIGRSFGQLAECLYLLREWQEVIVIVDRVVSLDPDLQVYSAAKGLALDKLDRPDEARVAHERALSDKANPQAYLDRSSEYAALAAYEHAIRDCWSAQELDPTLPDAYNALAWIYVEYMKENLDEATSLAKQSLERAEKPEHQAKRAMVLDTLGWTYYKRGLLNEARPRLEEASKLNPESLEAYLHLEACRQALETCEPEPATG